MSSDEQIREVYRMECKAPADLSHNGHGYVRGHSKPSPAMKRAIERIRKANAKRS